ncbi:MAG: 50S ribosomal protein L23 [Thermoplasmata archaeon]
MGRHDPLIKPFVTEKTTMRHVPENKIEFMVDLNTTKKDIKTAFEKLYQVKVESVNTRIMIDGKHAIVKLKPEYSASDLSMRMGTI